ncbi:MFS transporter [Halorubrum laminariae]|uniref:MFS transporter n=1 Tax=Halorubrum laminariae TaxID=1433523 RepID=A0ABD6C2M5_9EURY|nr:MFS transporter [Halorubrum laminariae]
MNTNDRALVQFTALAHGLFHTYELSIPLFVGLWMAEFGVSAAVIGAVVSVGYGVIGVGAPVSGVLSDRFDARRLISAAVIGMGIGFGVVALARGPITLGAAVLLWGCFASIYHPAGLSLISRTAEARGTVFAYHGAGGNVGTAFGPLLTALMLMFVDWRFAAGVLSVVAVLVGVAGTQIEFDTGAADDEADEADENDTARSDADGTDPDGTAGSIGDELRQMVTDSRALFGVAFTVAFGAILLYGVYYRGLLTFLPDVLAESPALAPVELLGQTVQPSQYVYTALLTVGIGGQYVGGRLTDRVPSLTAFLGFFTALAVLALAFPIVREAGTVPLVGICLLLGFFVYGTAPVYQVVVSEEAPDEVQGLSYGFTYLAMFGVGALGASIAGFVLTNASSAVLFAVLGGVAGLGALTVVALRRV